MLRSETAYSSAERRGSVAEAYVESRPCTVSGVADGPAVFDEDVDG